MNTIQKLNREELKQFQNNSENRMINHGHKQRIKKQMLESLDYFPPISVNSLTKHIIDGQHRFKAFVELYDEGLLPLDSKLEVKYLEIPIEKEKEAIVNANINSKNWSLEDYINSYAVKIPDYSLLKNWCNRHMLCNDGKREKFRYGSAMLKGKGCSKELKDGTFTLTQEELDYGEIVHNELVDILEILNKKTNNPFMEYLAISWCEVRHLHPYNVWRKELKQKKNVIMKKPSENKKEWNDIFGFVLRGIEIKAK